MQLESSSKYSFSILRTMEIIVSLMMILFLIFLNFYCFNTAQGQKKLSESIATQIIVGIPVRLYIPSLNINTPLESVGLTSEGAVEVPKSYTNAAWYNLGPRPGEIGNSIIDGHSGWKNGTQSIFDDLYKIKKGDKIYIIDEKGIVVTFIVREFRSYGPNEDVSIVFNSDDSKAHLNLITCVTSNMIQESPNDRFVVFSDKE